MKWFADLKCNPTNTDDVERSGRPKELTITENIKDVHIIVKDRRYIVDILQISTQRVGFILH